MNSAHRLAVGLALWLAAGGVNRAEPQGRIIVDTVHSRALRGNLIGDTPDREITVYLPPSYRRAASRRYPVLYLLHGMTSHPREWLDGSYQDFDLRQTMDSLVGRGMAEYIVVMPLADNVYGGTFYVNSPAFGRWEDFIADELVRFVDRRFRTRRGSRDRGLAGQSMGGFGALYLAGRRPDEFPYVYAMSPCCLGLVGDLALGSDVWALAGLDSGAVPRARAGQMRIVRAMARAFAAGASARPEEALRFPFEVDSLGGVREDEAVLRWWRARLPLDRVATDARPYRRLRAIALDFGREDEVASVAPGARGFARALTEAGVTHSLDEYTGGHTNRVRERFTLRLLPFFGRAFAAEAENHH